MTGAETYSNSFSNICHDINNSRPNTDKILLCYRSRAYDRKRVTL